LARYRLLGRACLLFGLLAAFAAAAPVFPAGPEPSVATEAEYWELIEHSRQVIAGLRDMSPAQARLKLLGLADQWAGIDSVRLADGRVLPIQHSLLLSALRAEDPDADRLLALLQALQSAHREYPAGVFEPGHLEPLQEILARPEFQWQAPRPNPLAEWFNQLWARINEWLAQLFGDRQAAIEVRLGGWSPLTIATTLLLIAILLYVFRNLWLDFAAEARLNEAGGPADEILTSHTAFQRAHDLSRGGDYRSAVRYLYLSALLLLDERGLLRYDRSKTNREYLHSLSAASGLAVPLREVIQVFDDVWYGNHALDEESFRHYSDRVQELRDRKL
jgi:hypothetical protein